ncbi:hypothetical protein BDW59DRAFT_137420 [Aspergillus cavernicola]|uniref:SRR1-like domain-containing protein n=1 Tax=Aspergillus cavernicola TaxID=176166 RepID=A0ABR4J865_9EURO
MPKYAMHSYLDRPLYNGKDADEWKPNSEEEAAANIKQWYQDGRLLYPRDTIQDVRDQLRKPLMNGEYIFVKAFDGSVYEFLVRIGELQKAYVSSSDSEEDKKEELVMTTPHIRYNSYEGLKQHLQWSLSRAYCSISIAHYLVPPNKSTAESPVDINTGVEFLHGIVRDWEASKAWREIKSTLLSLTLCSQIHKVIGMACGDFGRSDARGARRSAVQHALLLMLKRTLQESDLGTDEVACYAQDPIYSSIDRLVLESSGCKVVEDPDGFLEMDERSLVFSCAPNICVKQVIADIARPAILIWDTVQEDDPEYSRTDPNSPRVREMIRTCYDAFPFPEEHDGSFTSMAIYLNKEYQVPSKSDAQIDYRAG